jgi:hypothetical protein
MSLQISGRLFKKMDAVNKSDKFQTREFVIVTDGQYPNHILFQLTQDRCNLIDRYNENEELTIFFDIRGREWQGRYFNNLTVWKIEKTSGAANAGLAGQDLVADREAPDPFINAAESFDDLPF